MLFRRRLFGMCLSFASVSVLMSLGSYTRIMKARKTMMLHPLVQEVISQISTRFTPDVPDIKKAVDTLLEKEYIKRVEGELDTFTYVA